MWQSDWLFMNESDLAWDTIYDQRWITLVGFIVLMLLRMNWWIT